MNKQILIDKLTAFLMDEQRHTRRDAKTIATCFAVSIEAYLEDDNIYGDLRWSPPDIIDEASETYGIEVTREQAIEMFETTLNRMKFVNDMDYGWSLIDDAIRDRFGVTD